MTGRLATWRVFSGQRRDFPLRSPLLRALTHLRRRRGARKRRDVRPTVQMSVWGGPTVLLCLVLARPDGRVTFHHVHGRLPVWLSVVAVVRRRSPSLIGQGRPVVLIEARVVLETLR
jgi:hypothetical protein